MNPIARGILWAVLTVAVLAGSIATYRALWPLDPNGGPLGADDLAGVELGKSSEQATEDLIDALGEPSERAEWGDATMCGFEQAMWLEWDGIVAYFGRSSSEDPGAFVGYTASSPGAGTTVSGVTIDMMMQEVQLRAPYLEYFDAKLAGQGDEYIGLNHSASPTLLVGFLDGSEVDSISAGLRCFFGLPELPDVAVTTTTAPTTTTTTAPTTTTTRPTTTTTRATTTTTRATTTTASLGFPRWEVGFCAEDLGNDIVAPVSCSDPSADYVIYAIVRDESRCPVQTDFIVDLDDGTIACIG